MLVVNSNIYRQSTRETKQNANYDMLKARYNKTFIKAPFSGIIDMKFLEKGEMAPPGSPIVSIINIDKPSNYSGVPERYVTQVKKGKKSK